MRGLLALYSRPKLLLYIVGALLLLLGAGNAVQVALKPHWGHGIKVDVRRFALYIDAGSSGSRLHVFEYAPAAWPAYADIRLPEMTVAVEPGLSSFATNPALAAESLTKLLALARQQVPLHLQTVTPVHLLATAGLRLLAPEDVEAILAACRWALASSGFLFHADWARVMAGDLEGLYGWAAANYVSGALQDAALRRHHQGREEALIAHAGPALDVAVPFEGVLELGGASVQITFMPATAGPPQAGLSRLPLPGIASPLFTRSLLGLGMDSALLAAEQLVLATHEADNSTGAPLDPCLPTGYEASDGRRGNASFAECLLVAHRVLPLQGCTPVKCALEGHVVPDLTGNFLAIENFFWVQRAIDAPRTATLAEFALAGERYCAMHWSSLHAEFSGHIPQKFLLRYCFGAAYVHTLLHRGFGIGLDERRIVFTNTLESKSGVKVGLNWVVGAMLVEAMNAERHGMLWFMDRSDGAPTSRIFAALLLPVLAIIVLLVGLAFYAMSIMRGGQTAVTAAGGGARVGWRGSQGGQAGTSGQGSSGGGGSGGGAEQAASGRDFRRVPSFWALRVE